MVQIGVGDDASVEMFKNGDGRITLLALLMRCRAMTVKCGLEMCVEMWLPGGLTWCWSIVYVRLISCPVSEPQLEVRKKAIQLKSLTS